MKKILSLITFCFLFNFISEAQKIDNPNTFYITFQPFNHGIGVRYDRMINSFHGLFGVYTSITNREFELETGEYKHTNKLVTGVLLYSNPRNKNVNFYFGTGVAYNIYNGLQNDPPTFPKSEFDKIWSFELSANTRIKNYMNIGIRIDPFKKEYSLDTGISF